MLGIHTLFPGGVLGQMTAWLVKKCGVFNLVLIVSLLNPEQVKAAFTRAYNKEAHLTPYALHVVKTSKRQPGSELASELNEELNADDFQPDEDEQDTIESDAMIKVILSANCTVA